MQSVSFASMLPSLFENLELQLCAELFSVWGVVMLNITNKKSNNMLNIYDQKSFCVGGITRTNARLICRLSWETKHFSNQKASWQKTEA